MGVSACIGRVCRLGEKRGGAQRECAWACDVGQCECAHVHASLVDAGGWVEMCVRRHGHACGYIEGGGGQCARVRAYICWWGRGCLHVLCALACVHVCVPACLTLACIRPPAELRPSGGVVYRAITFMAPLGMWCAAYADGHIMMQPVTFLRLPKPTHSDASHSHAHNFIRIKVSTPRLACCTQSCALLHDNVRFNQSQT